MKFRPALILLTACLVCFCFSDSAISADNPGSGPGRPVSFSQATAGKLPPINLEFKFPENYDISPEAPEGGVFWADKKDIDAVLKGRGSFSGARKSVFHFYLSRQTSYYQETGMFSGENETPAGLKAKGASAVKSTRRVIGGYPVWLISYNLDNEDIRIANIATFNGGNVVAIAFHSGQEASSTSEKLWNDFIASMRRPAYKAAEVKGADASWTIANVTRAAVASGRRKVVITSEMVLGPDSALERPTVRERLVLSENASGFEECGFEHSASAVLEQREGSVSTITTFNDGWSFPSMKGRIKFKDGIITGGLSSDSKSVSISDPVDNFKEGNNVYQIFFLGPWITAESFAGVLDQILGVFEFKQEISAEGIVLNGVPRREEFSKMFERVQMPLVENGVDMADELMKRWAKATVIVDPVRWEVKEFRVNGVYGFHPLAVAIAFEMKDGQS